MHLWHKKIEIAGVPFNHWIITWYQVRVASFYTGIQVDPSRTAAEYDLFAGGVLHPN